MIEILKAGTLTTIQDSGRLGYQELGVPETGALDAFSFRCANLLTGNHANVPVIEAVLFGPQVKFSDDSFIAITGGDLSPTIDGAKVNLWETLQVSAGSILSFSGPIGKGIRSYIAISGGFSGDKTRSVMGSYSTYLPGGFGGYEGRALKDDDVLHIGEPDKKFEGGLVFENPPYFGDDETLRIILGPQDDMFAPAAIQTLISSSYQVTPNSDRMGCRLDGPVLEHLDGPDVISDGTAFGVIQVPGDGKPIILLSDRGTTGGYTKIATVISADRSKLAQLMPGGNVNFEVVSQEKAVNLLKDQERLLSSIKVHGGVPFNIKVNGMSVDIVDDDNQPAIGINIEHTTYKAVVSDGHQDHEIELEISE